MIIRISDSLSVNTDYIVAVDLDEKKIILSKPIPVGAYGKLTDIVNVIDGEEEDRWRHFCSRILSMNQAQMR